MKENFYHGILLGILGFQQNWSVSLNKESGDGYSDILIETEDQETGIIIEIKYAKSEDIKHCIMLSGSLRFLHIIQLH